MTNALRKRLPLMSFPLCNSTRANNNVLPSESLTTVATIVLCLSVVHTRSAYELFSTASAYSNLIRGRRRFNLNRRLSDGCVHWCSEDSGSLHYLNFDIIR